jgi:hypothetical protein
MRFMYSPNFVAIPAGSPNQHRKALSGSVGLTDEQDLARDEQDLALFRRNLRKPGIYGSALLYRDTRRY